LLPIFRAVRAILGGSGGNLNRLTPFYVVRPKSLGARQKRGFLHFSLFLLLNSVVERTTLLRRRS
jgi:hypothetical protein